MPYNSGVIQRFANRMKVGMRFCPHLAARKHYGEELIIVRISEESRNPDNIQWEAKDSKGALHNVRNWWLRQYCREIY